MHKSKRGQGRGYYKSYNDHDDRVGGSHNSDGARRVSFKSQGNTRNKRNNRNNRQQGWDTKHIRSLILSNDDIDMSGHYSRAGDRQNRYGGGGGGQGKRGGRFLKYMPGHYYRVEIRYGSRYEKDYLLKVLASHIKPTPLLPLDCKPNGNNFNFTLHDYSTAEKVLQANREVTLNDGWKISIVVRPYQPVIEMTPKLTAAVKAAMAKRYNVETKALDLTQFQDDNVFLSEELICALHRPNVMSYVIELIAESVPDLVALSLNRNGMAAIEHLKAMIDKLPHLRILHMAHNSIKDVKQLDPLKGLKLVEINLDGNNLASQFNDKDDYIREIRKRFPKVIKLDGIDLPKPITFDLEDDDAGNLPKSREIFMCDTDRGAAMVKTFVEQYFMIFDSNDRSALIQAYHDHAHFSTLCYLTSSDSVSMFTAYMPDNRNLMKVSQPERRLKLLKTGKFAIVEALKNFPETEHELSTFVVDLVLFTPELIQLSVGGLFREKTKPNPTGSPIKYFNRIFVIVPVGPGFCIVNEEFCIHYPTTAQLKLMNSKKAEAAQAQGPSSVDAPPVGIVPQVVNGVSPENLLAKQQMVTQLAAQTGMNLIWSEKCLNETNWNFDQAVFAFMQLKDAGTIPMEAFQK